MSRILIVEDNQMNMELSCELLELAGHKVIKAFNGTDGFKFAKLKSPDLIILELNLKDIDGLTLTKRLKEHHLTQNIPIIAFTSFMENSFKEKAFGAGCEEFIPKPLDINTFVPTIEQYIKISNTKANSDILLPAKNSINENIYTNKWHKVLVIDDNLMNTEILKETLEQIRQTAVVAHSGKQALEFLNTDNFDLILLDIMMPEMSGFDLIKIIKADSKKADIPVIFVSALNETEEIIRGLKLGSYGYITKPFNIEEMKARILNALRIKDLQDEITAEKNKLDLIFQSSADSILMLNSNFEIISCNDNFFELTKLTKEEVLGSLFCAIIECERANNSSCILDFKNSSQSKTTFTRILKNDNDKKYLQINLSKIHPQGKEAEGYVLAIRDVTAFKEIEKQKETFVATLTHDLKTPIRAEIMALDLLLKGNFGNLNKEQSEIVLETLYSNKYMLNMVDNLLSTYRYENGNIPLKKDFIEINSIILNCYNELKYIINDKMQSVSFEFETQERIIQADPFEIKRVIINLLSNAVNYTDHEGKILIKTSIKNDKFLVSFIDNGRGISNEDISFVFNKYTSYARKFRQVGTGLGLYLSKQIIEAHKGSIYVKSEEGKGSDFTFELPLFQIKNDEFIKNISSIKYSPELSF